MSLTVKQLKEKLPAADVTELRDGVKYIVRLKSYATEDAVRHAQQVLKDLGVNALVVDASAVEFLEIVDG
jgi:peptidoglycan hydrolase-like protein with peptidoglycan-binding domain